LSPATRDKFNFTSVESCALFLEGVRALNLYEEETGKHSPSLDTLKHTLDQALDKLGDCVRIYPDDRVAHFYYAIVLTLRNQEIYAGLLRDIKEALVAEGRFLNVLGMLRLYEAALDLSAQKGPPVPDENGESFRSEYKKQKTASEPFSNLVNEQWPLLEEAAHEFEYVQSNGPDELKNTAAYNLAQVDGRRGSAKSLEHGLKVLDDIKLNTKPSIDERALSLQIDILRYHLEARFQIDTKGEKSRFDRSWKALEGMPSAISKESGLSSAYKIDLQADYLVKSGYVLYDQALHDYFTDTPIDFLHAAADRFSKALFVRKSWNQAQLYLAVALAIQSGVYPEFSKQSDQLFDSLLGTPEIKSTKTSLSEADSFLKAARELFQAVQGKNVSAEAETQEEG